MPISVLEAIKLGQWDFEPTHLDDRQYRSTNSLPGSRAKLDVLAERARMGLPLWHPADRHDCEDLHLVESD